MSKPTEKESITNIRKAYFCYYNRMLHSNRIDMKMFNPILLAYRNGELTLKESITLINQKTSNCPDNDQHNTIASEIELPLSAIINKDSRIKSCQVCNGGFDYYLIFTDNSKMFMSCGAAGNFISISLSSINKLIKSQKFEKVI